MKIRSSIKKRFKFTSKGNIRFLSSNRKHNMHKKSACSIRKIKSIKFLSNIERKRVKNLLH